MSRGLEEAASCRGTGSGCSREVTVGKIATHKMLGRVHIVDADSKSQVRPIGVMNKVTNHVGGVASNVEALLASQRV